MKQVQCPHCQMQLDLAQILTQDIRDDLLSEQSQAHQKALKTQKQEMENQVAQAVAQAKAQEGSQQMETINQLQQQSHQDRKINQELRDKINNLIEQLSQAEEGKRSVESEMKLKMLKEKETIRQEAIKEADDKHSLKRAELEKKLADTTKSLNEAQRRAEQGLNTTQGEVLELRLEDQLAEAFRQDRVEPVKAGRRGADIKQFVRNRQGVEVGLILWEIKNARWQKSWIEKFKNDIRQIGANEGVLVSRETPNNLNLQKVEDRLWIVKPRLAVFIAEVLRVGLIQLYGALQMNVGKNEKLENLFQFITSPAFKHRIEAIADNYTRLQQELEKEKKQAHLRWARQEQIQRQVINNIIGVHGDLQGITNELPELKIDSDDYPLE